MAGVRIRGGVALVAVLVMTGPALASPRRQSQDSNPALGNVTRKATLEFLERDGNCVQGTIAKSDARGITVQPTHGAPVVIPRAALLQAAQGAFLVYSARSSWADVSHIQLSAGDALEITLKDGEHVRGRPVQVTSDGILLRHGFKTSEYAKNRIAAVAYQRDRPATDDFNLMEEEAAWASIFYPEFYSRMFGVEGRMVVPVYNASELQDDSAGVRGCFGGR